jgi:amino acid adenylation domain-containing protein
MLDGRDPSVPVDQDANSPEMARTLAAAFIRQCQADPGRLACAFVRDTLELSEAVSYGELYEQVRRLGRLISRHSACGDRVLLMYPSGIDFVRAFWACVVTGRIAVPVPAPDAARLKNSAPRLLAIIGDASASLLLTTENLREAAQLILAESVSGVPAVFATDPHWLPEEFSACGQSIPEPAIEPDTVAYLQYTSGSTSAPRGVVLTHANVLAQCRAGARCVAMSTDSRVLNWLPHHHDFGLIGTLMPLCVGATVYLMSSLTFLRRPLRWLDAVGKFGITHTGGPNFAYAACVRAHAQQPGWTGDLSTLRSASCGAEPISVATMEAFALGFAPHGLSDKAVKPSYGMAEAVLAITMTPTDASMHAVTVDKPALAKNRVRRLLDAANETRKIMCCGRAIDGMEVAVVDPRTRTIVDRDVVGELWVRGDCVGHGYWNQPDATEATFQARLATGEGPWLRTGDLGFMQDGDVFVTGRMKDLIIVHGRNLYPQDIEWTVQKVDERFRPGYGAAFSVDSDEGDLVVIVQELERKCDERNLTEIAAAIRRAVADEHEIPLAAVVLVRSGSLPRTSSGKIRRRSCRQDYLDGTLSAVFVDDGSLGAREYEAPLGEIESVLAEIWSEVLRRDGIGRQDCFIDLGGHSLLATQMVSRVRMRLAVDLPLMRVFERATLAESAAEIARLRLAGGACAAQARLAFPKVERSGPVPASYSQRRMWLVQKMNPETVAYNMPAAFRIRGRVDPVAMEAAVNRVARHHEAFRTRFELVDGEPMQRIEADCPATLEFVALDHLPAGERDERARTLLQERVQSGFDLTLPALHRPTLLRLDEYDHVLLWVIHHAVGDLWSFGVILRDLSLAYDALLANRDVALASHAIEYADYAAWQRDPAHWLEIERQMAYWRSRLQGLRDLALPSDLQRRTLPSGAGGRVIATLPAATIDEIKRFSQHQGVSPFMTLLGCYAVLLGRYCDQDDIAVGTPIANRHRFESEHLVGTLVNTLVMRTDLSGNPTFVELLQRIRDRALEAYANQDAPFEVLVEELAVSRDMSLSPLVRVMFNVVNAPFETLTFAGERIAPFDFDRGAAQFDLAVTVDTEVFGQVHLEYAADLFVQATARRMLNNYMLLLEQVMVDPNRSIHAYSIPSADERAELDRLNDTRSAYPSAACIQTLLAAQVRRAPDSVAVVQPGAATLSYGELDARGNQLARALRARGVGRGALVGLCVERGLGMVIAQQAVLKSGAAYVPLDPAYPADRLAFMAEDARLALLVTESTLVSTLAWPRERSLWLDADAAAIAQHPDAPLAPDETLDARSEDPAYVIYTSGSTGKPKGVVVPHGAVVNFLVSMAREPGLSAADTLVAVTTLSFDIAVLELLLPLSVGARVVLATRDQALDGVVLRELIESHRVTVMQATPATWRILIDSGWQGSPSFKALIGGEGLPQDLATQLQARTGELWNMYGPTETTVWSTCWKVERPEGGITIGRPIANTTVRILDERLRVCPFGVPGEIYIGGAGITLGYLNRPDLTAERFIADPFATGERLYRTGDRGRWRHDGLLEHMGRLDFQVKVRGYRIELGEIESNLAHHPQVARTVVIVREDTPGDVRLVAYVVPRNVMPDALALREYLRDSLPEYMIPQRFVEIEAIPLLPNGKINRNELPAPADSSSFISCEFVAPGDEIEQAVAEVWQRLLGVSQVGVADNFFDLGGHSLLAMRAVTELNQRFGSRLAVRQIIFESLGQIAASIKATSALQSADQGGAEKGAARDAVLAQPRSGWFATVLGRRR